MSCRVGAYSKSHSRKLVRKYEAKQGEREEHRPAKSYRLQDAADDPLALDPLAIGPGLPPSANDPYGQAMEIDPILIDEEGENSSDGDEIELPVVDD